MPTHLSLSLSLSLSAQAMTHTPTHTHTNSQTDATIHKSMQAQFSKQHIRRQHQRTQQDGDEQTRANAHADNRQMQLAVLRHDVSLCDCKWCGFVYVCVCVSRIHLRFDALTSNRRQWSGGSS